MYSRSSAAGPPPETKICQTCSRVMSCGDGCTKTMSFTTLLHLYKLKALFTFILLVSNATSEQNTAIYSTGFLAPPLTILLLALCCQPCTQTRTVPKCGNLQNLETYHAFTSTKRAPKADLLIYSIVQCIMYIHIFKLQLFFLHLPVRPDFLSQVIMCMLPQCRNMWWIITGHQRFLSNDPKMQIFCSEEMFYCPAVRYLTPGNACIQ